MKLIWMAVPALVAVAVAGCSDDKSSTAASTSAVTAESSSVPATPAPEELDEPGTGTRIPLGETKNVLIPADAVMDIKIPAEWGKASSALRCAVTDSTGRNEDLRSTNMKKPEEIGGEEWITLWTFSSPAGADIAVGCKDQESEIPAADNPYIRVVPRGITPH